MISHTVTLRSKTVILKGPITNQFYSIGDNYRVVLQFIVYSDTEVLANQHIEKWIKDYFNIPFYGYLYCSHHRNLSFSTGYDERLGKFVTQHIVNAHISKKYDKKLVQFKLEFVK